MATTRRWRKRFLLLGGLGLFLLLLTGIPTFFAYRYYVVENPGAHLERADILRRIAMESPVYYNDGRHKLGVFFGEEHRQYVKFGDIPVDFVHAIVSSEDSRFFVHPGFDVLGIARATVANFKAGRVVAGGSTITQQTAKNLYHRPDRSFSSKLEELINALRLEARYSKSEILEFYTNQFHVHSNGRGLGIAARYFFDKEVKDLSRLECIFLAGVVKGPFNYNPFVQPTEEARQRARERARNRTHYVIRRMVENGYLTEAEADALRKQELVFKEGDFRYEQNILLDYVFNVLQQPRFTELFKERNIENPATAGLQIITTIDREAQLAAQYGLRHNLSEVGAWLEGLTLDAFLSPDAPLMPVAREDVIPYTFFEGRVLGPLLKDGQPTGLRVDLGGVEAEVPFEGIRRIANLLKQAKGKTFYTRAGDDEVRALIQSFPAGRGVSVSVLSLSPAGVPQVDLEATTGLQGALVVLDQGRLRAMVGGQDNRNFNRALQARRQLGSTFKPLIYAAALSLGWKTTSPIDNRRQGFYFQREWYWPRSDHEGVTPYVSMGFAGATSENLATVSLLYHLTDMLNDDQFRDLATRVGMLPQPGEAQEAYVQRMRDTHGIIPSDGSLAEAAFGSARRDYTLELGFGGRAQEASELSWVQYGTGYDQELARTQKYVTQAADRAARQRFLSRGFLQLETLLPEALQNAQILLEGQQPIPSSLLEQPSPATALPPLPGGAPSTVPGVAAEKPGEKLEEKPGDKPAEKPVTQEGAAAAAELQVAAAANFYTRREGSITRLIYSHHPEPGWTRPTLGELRQLLTTRSVPPPAPEASVAEDASPTPPPAMAVSTPARPEDVILLEGALSCTSVRELRARTDARRLELEGLPPFSPDRLILEPEFRVRVGMLYVIELARAMGVTSPLKPVLSLALGSNEITLVEAAMIYQTFLRGDVYAFDGETVGTAIIEEIREPSGEVIYRAEGTSHPLLDVGVGTSVGRILRGVFERGTAARSRAEIRVDSLSSIPGPQATKDRPIVPLFGKTGTTNDYLNVAFVGFLPTPLSPSAALPYGDALTIASYVGYDDNRPMKRGSIRVQGSNGALPAWLDAARGISRKADLSRLLPPEALQPGKELPIGWPAAFKAIAVDETTGLPVSGSIVADPTLLPPGSVPFEVWGTEDAVSWRERETYIPFTPWGATPAVPLPVGPGLAPPADPAILETPSGAPNATSAPDFVQPSAIPEEISP